MKLRFISMLGKIVGIADDDAGMRLPVRIPVAHAPSIFRTDAGYHITGGDPTARHQLLQALRDHYGAHVVIKPSGNDGAEVLESRGAEQSTYDFENPPVSTLVEDEPIEPIESLDQDEDEDEEVLNDAD